MDPDEDRQNIRIQTVWHSDGISEISFQKKSADVKKHEKFPIMQRFKSDNSTFDMSLCFNSLPAG